MSIDHKKKILHLYWKAGFGLSPSEYAVKSNWSIEEAVADIFSEAKNPSSFGKVKPMFQSREEMRSLSDEEKKELQQMNRNTNTKLTTDWLMRMGNPAHSCLVEKMSLFWHGHFACESKLPHLNVKQHNTIRKHALGNFRDLVMAISKDPAMILYLNNQQNRKEKPNENYARELMELFTLGIGNYTEKDIKEAARAFTGWTTNFKGEFTFRKFLHDYGVKTFMGYTGQFAGEDIVDIILQQKQVSRFIAGKVFRFFVNDTINEDHVDEIAGVFLDSGYNIEVMMKHIFLSDWFYEAENIGSKIKSPSELLAGMIRVLGVKFSEHRNLLFAQKLLGQVLLNPPNVAGWPGGKAWIDNSTLMVRLNLAGWLFDGAEVNIRLKDQAEMASYNLKNRKINASMDIKPLIDQFLSLPYDEIYPALETYLIQPEIKIDRKEVERFTSRKSKEEYVATLALRFLSLPEYQVC